MPILVILLSDGQRLMFVYLRIKLCLNQECSGEFSSPCLYDFLPGSDDTSCFTTDIQLDSIRCLIPDSDDIN